MTRLLQRPIVIKSGDNISEGLLYLRGLNVRERRIRAAKIWGLMWLLALLSLPLVIVHFVLVPGFLIAGPVMAFKRYRIAEVPDHVSGNCPSDKEELTLTLQTFDRLPMWVRCPSCNAWLHLLIQ